MFIRLIGWRYADDLERIILVRPRTKHTDAPWTDRKVRRDSGTNTRCFWGRCPDHRSNPVLVWPPRLWGPLDWLSCSRSGAHSRQLRFCRATDRWRGRNRLLHLSGPRASRCCYKNGSGSPHFMRTSG